MKVYCLEFGGEIHYITPKEFETLVSYQGKNIFFGYNNSLNNWTCSPFDNRANPINFPHILEKNEFIGLVVEESQKRISEISEKISSLEGDGEEIDKVEKFLYETKWSLSRKNVLSTSFPRDQRLKEIIKKHLEKRYSSSKPTFEWDDGNLNYSLNSLKKKKFSENELFYEILDFIAQKRLMISNGIENQKRWANPFYEFIKTHDFNILGIDAEFTNDWNIRIEERECALRYILVPQDYSYFEDALKYFNENGYDLYEDTYHTEYEPTMFFYDDEEVFPVIVHDDGRIEEFKED